MWGKVIKHKILSVFLAVVLIGGGYYIYGNLNSSTAQTRYVLAAVQKGTLISSVSGSGQVSALNQVDLKAKVSGDVILVNVQDGQEVKTGQLIVQLDSKVAQKSVRDAEAALESAKLALIKIKQPADALSTLQAENALAQSQDTKQKAQNDLQNAYDDGFSTVAGILIDLPNIITFSSGMTSSQWNSTNGLSYDLLLSKYTKNYNDYQSASRYSDQATLDALFSETYDTVKTVDAAIKSSGNASYITKADGHLSDILGVTQTIENDKNAINSADRSIAANTAPLTKLKAGALPIDIQSQELTIKQRENALSDAKGNLADYSITAPFDGFIANLSVNKGDSVASIQSYGVIASLITKKRIAGISLNEVDVAKVKIGQKATLIFDAFPDLTISGDVAQIDTIGTVTQGVVSYNVKITFDTQDDRIKPSMSVSASVITDVKQDVLTVSNSAVKSQGGTSYVELVSSGSSTQSLVIGQSTTLSSAPTVQTVQTGLSNDSITEITSGLKEGDVVIVRTVASSTQTSTTQSSGVRIQGGGGFGL